MKLIVEERLIVDDNDQCSDAIMHTGPERGEAHQVIAVAEHRNRQSFALAQRQCGTHRHARSRANAAASVEADVIERMRKAAELARPSERKPDIGRAMRRQDLRRPAGEIFERESIPGRGGRLAGRLVTVVVLRLEPRRDILCHRRIEHRQ